MIIIVIYKVFLSIKSEKSSYMTYLLSLTSRLTVT